VLALAHRAKGIDYLRGRPEGMPQWLKRCGLKCGFHFVEQLLCDRLLFLK
jgi:hypothetical protein